MSDNAATQWRGKVPVSYTPGFVLDGMEWRGWFDREPLPVEKPPETGVLDVEWTDGVITASFDNAATHRGDGAQLVLHVALLGFGIEEKIGAGENAGRTLTHDFVVLDYSELEMVRRGGRWTATTPLPVAEHAPKHGVAAWVSDPETNRPSAGGRWLASRPVGSTTKRLLGDRQVRVLGDRFELLVVDIDDLFGYVERSAVAHGPIGQRARHDIVVDFCPETPSGAVETWWRGSTW